MEREIDILKKTDHPHIIKYYATFHDEKYFHIVMEYCNGGELFERLTTTGKFDESRAKHTIENILKAISHLHSKDIIHRDLKPENLLFNKPGDTAEIKLIDFGLAKFGANKNQLHTKVGTPYYVSPEVLKG